MLLPLNQPLLSEGLKITYTGMKASGGFRLDVVIQNLDPDVTYPRDVGVSETIRGFTIADRHFTVEKITQRYLRLRSSAR